MDFCFNNHSVSLLFGIWALDIEIFLIVLIQKIQNTLTKIASFFLFLLIKIVISRWPQSKWMVVGSVTS